MKRFTELLKVLLIVGALTTVAFSAAATDIIITCEPGPDICVTMVDIIEVTDDLTIITTIVIEGFIEDVFILE